MVEQEAAASALQAEHTCWAVAVLGGDQEEGVAAYHSALGASAVDTGRIPEVGAGDRNGEVAGDVLEAGPG